MFNALLHSNTPKANNGKLNILYLLRFSGSVPKISLGYVPKTSD